MIFAQGCQLLIVLVCDSLRRRLICLRINGPCWHQVSERICCLRDCKTGFLCL